MFSGKEETFKVGGVVFCPASIGCSVQHPEINVFSFHQNHGLGTPTCCMWFSCAQTWASISLCRTWYGSASCRFASEKEHFLRNFSTSPRISQEHGRRAIILNDTYVTCDILMPWNIDKIDQRFDNQLSVMNCSKLALDFAKHLIIGYRFQKSKNMKCCGEISVRWYYDLENAENKCSVTSVSEIVVDTYENERRKGSNKRNF